MSNFILSRQSSLTAIMAGEPGRTRYSLDAAAQLSEIHPDLLRYYCRAGLLGEEKMQAGGELLFDDDALYEVRRIEHYRRHHGVNLSALPLVFALLHEVERLSTELRLLR